MSEYINERAEMRVFRKIACELREIAMQNDSPVYLGDKEVDSYVRLSDVMTVLENNKPMDLPLERWKSEFELPCKKNDTVYDVVLCDDGKYRIFEMFVCDIRVFGSLRKGNVWNVYLENDFTKAYRSFYDFGKTVFLTKQEAEEALNCMVIPMKKYEFTGETKLFCGNTVRRIRAVVSFSNIKKGELGGWIKEEGNLSQEGNSWVYENSYVFGNAKVYENAEVSGNAKVYGNANVFGESKVYGNANVSGNANVCGYSYVYGNAMVSGNAYLNDSVVFRTRHILVIGSIGSRNDFTTFFRNENNGISVKCGCFHGGIDTFIERVKNTHGNSKYAQVYLAAAELAKLQIDLSCKKEKYEAINEKM